MLGPRGALIAALAFATNVETATLARAAVTAMTLAFHTLAASSGRILIIAKAASERRLKEVTDIFPLDRRGGYVLYSSRPSE